ncbi:SRPBCC family protein [Tabrizicola sp.]|uniref:SRPBCC family protein n=1 Tax=Tabrizicola sp. TaxID=2005166 RepID=UPI00273711A9|nr:SRPBCC family protein [Tabrizicola sp.]MDP3194711.1 SRPBCC family protein [Tabrizicola sp.]
MPTITVTRKSKANTARVWDLMSDFGAIDAFNPTLKESHLLDGSCEIGLGAERQCTLKDGKNYIHERVVDWQEGRSYRIEVFGGTMPMDNITAELAVAPEPQGSTLRMTMTYSPRWGLFGQLIDPVLLRPMMRHTMRKVIGGLAAKA